MSETENLFLGTISDIEQKLSDGTTYNLIRGSGLIRHLFLDANSLANQVNRKYKLRLQFSIVDTSSIKDVYFEKSEGKLIIQWDNIDPSHLVDYALFHKIPLEGLLDGEHLWNEMFPKEFTPLLIRQYELGNGAYEQDTIHPNYHKFFGVKTKNVSSQQFLSTKCLFYRGHNYSVSDIIKACAHIRGGVHSGTANSDKEKGILNLDEVLEVGGVDATLATLKGIMKVSIKGLEPLVAKVKASN
jgi:hypothetical protein